MRQSHLAVLLIVLFLGRPSLNAQTAGASAPDLFTKGMNALEGSSATRSAANAIEYFRQSAALGYAPAQTVLGYVYETGQGTTPDPREAFEFYKKAAQQDDPLAEWLVARMIFSGEVPPRDLNESARWLEKSSAQGNTFADYLLGKIALERGNYSRAGNFLSKSAQQGLPQAQWQLAVLLRGGQGVPQDEFEAYVWMLVSSDQGFRPNDPQLQSLETELSAAQLEQAKTKARELEGSATRSVTARGCTGWPGEFDEIPAPPPPDIQRFCR
ncbi:MAG TPA: tetratricopeptide repeat protein [Verrucomicrobiae bacterium]|nr:tetratricopeptide repeat protein [Verrucomicrobiae bacterium]